MDAQSFRTWRHGLLSAIQVGYFTEHPWKRYNIAYYQLPLYCRETKIRGGRELCGERIYRFKNALAVALPLYARNLREVRL
jgi:hypothetical protein